MLGARGDAGSGGTARWALVVDARASTVVSVLAGGNYWSHYLIQLVGPLSVLVGVAAAAGRESARARVVRRRSVVVGVVAWTVALPWQTDVVRPAWGRPIGGRVGHPGDTIVTVYGHADVDLASGLSSPYPYLWSLPTKTLDPQLHVARPTCSAARRRPTWFVTWSRLSLVGRRQQRRLAGCWPRATTRSPRLHGHTVYLRNGVADVAPRCDPWPGATTHPRSPPPSRSSCHEVRRRHPDLQRGRQRQGCPRRRAARASADSDVLVVDDNSPDGTATRCGRTRSSGSRVHLLEPAGQGGPRSGLPRRVRVGARGRATTSIVQMDADLSHPPERVPALIDALEDADVAIGSRYVAGGGVARLAAAPPAHLLGRQRLRPPRARASGPRCDRRVQGVPPRGAAALRVLDSESNGYCFQIENTWRACRAGLSVDRGADHVHRPRPGESKMSADIVREALLRVLVWRWRELHRHRVPRCPLRRRPSRRSVTMRLPDVVRRHRSHPEVLTFLAVGGAGYVVDVAAFNLLRSTATLGAGTRRWPRSLAVAAAMVVTYVGNQPLTWRGEGDGNRRARSRLFVLFNVIGLGFSVVTLTVSHDLLGLTSRLADNISANVVGLALGTLFRYWSYKKFVFGPVSPNNRDADSAVPGKAGNRDHALPRLEKIRP